MKSTKNKPNRSKKGKDYTTNLINHKNEINLIKKAKTFEKSKFSTV